jgi:hypothetical protein
VTRRTFIGADVPASHPRHPARARVEAIRRLLIELGKPSSRSHAVSADDRSNDLLGNLVLHCEDVGGGQLTVIGSRPEVGPVLRVEKLRRYQERRPDFLNASFQDVASTKFLAEEAYDDTLDAFDVLLMPTTRMVAPPPAGAWLAKFLGIKDLVSRINALDEHVHTYPTGEGPGHNSVEAATEPADLLVMKHPGRGAPHGAQGILLRLHRAYNAILPEGALPVSS